MNDALVKIDAARRALAEARSVADVKDIRDKAEAVRTYLRQQSGSLEAMNHAAELKLRAERKLGDLLAETVENHRPKKLSRDVTVLPEGVTRMQSSRWQLIASVPEPEFDRHVFEVKKQRLELTSAGVLSLARLHRAPNQAPPLPKGRYRIVYADPPWQYRDRRPVQGFGCALNHYPTLSTDELRGLGVRALAHTDAALFLWVPVPLLPEAFPVVRDWGFEYRSLFVWDKVRHNFGHYSSVRCELLLICIRGSLLPAGALEDNVISLERSRHHSEKPASFRELIDRLYPPAAAQRDRIELFARGKLPRHWDGWGNEHVP